MGLKEVLIAAHNSREGYTIEGDIVSIRDPIGFIGRIERRNYLILLVDEADLPDPADLHNLILAPGHKHRYNITLTSIPGLDISRSRDPNDPYQPFASVNPQTGRITRLPVSRISYNRKAG